MTTEELIDNLAIPIDGEKDEREITIFTLSTCMWCKKCKRWLNERNVKYRYIDVDKIQYSQKSEILKYLKKNYQQRISYPYMVCDKKDVVVGYNPGKYEELMKGGRE
ncbi:MAG: glutaredoxin family protein [Candidatus Hodarchaeota archaeon]